MTAVKNRGTYARTWDRLVNSTTGRTLHLAAGEQGETELPEGFHDPYLEVVVGEHVIPEGSPAAKQKVARAAVPETTSEATGDTPAADVPATKTEE